MIEWNLIHPMSKKPRGLQKQVFQWCHTKAGVFYIPNFVEIPLGGLHGLIEFTWNNAFGALVTGKHFYFKHQKQIIEEIILKLIKIIQ